MYYILAAMVMVIAPGIAAAQTGNVQSLLGGIGGFMNDVLIPLLLGLAFLFFVINAVRFFVIGGSSDEGQEHAKRLAIYGVATFVFILSFWGIVNVLGSGLGIDADPCDSDKTSDYIISSLAPCASPFPQTKPTTTTSPVTSGAGTVGTAGGGASANGGNDTSFDINGNPIAYKPVTAAQAILRTKATAYFSSHDFQVIYGPNASLVKNILFADLDASSQSTTVTETERVKAAFRLLNAGVITQTEYTSYLNAVNTYTTATKQPAITAPTATSITVAIPAEVKVGITQSKTAIANTLTDYNNKNDMGPSPVNVPATITALFDTSIPTVTRWQTFKTLYDNTSNENELKITDPGPDFPIFTKFRANLNTENAFKGNFTLIW